MTGLLRNGLKLALTLAALGAASSASAEPTPLIAQSCAGCHGQAGEGAGGTPRIAGLDRGAFVETWAAFRTGERPASIMNRIAPGFTEAEVAALADFFSAQK